jgi:hypothetical protein
MDGIKTNKVMVIGIEKLREEVSSFFQGLLSNSEVMDLLKNGPESDVPEPVIHALNTGVNNMSISELMECCEVWGEYVIDMGDDNDNEAYPQVDGIIVEDSMGKQHVMNKVRDVDVPQIKEEN